MTQELELTSEQKTSIAKSFEVQEIELGGYANAYKHIISQEITSDLSAQARELRLDLVKERSSINQTHKVQKAYFLNGGRFVDSLKNTLIDKIKNMEDKLKDIELHEQRLIEANQIKLQAERSIKLSKYTENIPSNLGEMDQDMFDAILIGIEHKFKQEEKEILELEAKQLKEAEETELYNKRLFSIHKYSYFADIDNLPLTKQTTESEFKVILEQLEVEKSSHDAKLAKEREVAQKERERAAQEKKKLDAELKKEKLKKQEEAKEKARLEELKKAPVKNQLSSWVDSFILEDAPVDNAISKDILSKFEGFKKWAKSEINKI